MTHDGYTTIAFETASECDEAFSMYAALGGVVRVPRMPCRGATLAMHGRDDYGRKVCTFITRLVSEANTLSFHEIPVRS